MPFQKHDIFDDDKYEFFNLCLTLFQSYDVRVHIIKNFVFCENSPEFVIKHFSQRFGFFYSGYKFLLLLFPTLVLYDIEFLLYQKTLRNKRTGYTNSRRIQMEIEGH